MTSAAGHAHARTQRLNRHHLHLSQQQHHHQSETMTMGSASNNTNESTSSDVSKLVSMGFDRSRAIKALNEHGGSLDGAIDSLTGGGGGSGSWADDWGPSRSEADTATDSPLKLIDNDDNHNENMISLPTTTTTSMEGKSWEDFGVKSSSYLLPNADAPPPSSSSLSLPAAAAARRVEIIEDNDGPEPPVSMLPDANQNNSKKLSALTTTRMEQVEDNVGPQPPTEMIMAGFHDDEGAKKFRNDNSKMFSALLVGDQRQGAAAISMETATDGIVSFDSTEGQNYFRDNTNTTSINNTNTTTNSISNSLVGRWENSAQERHANAFSGRVEGVDATARNDPAVVVASNNAILEDEAKSDSMNSKSDSSDHQEEYMAIIPEAFLVEEEPDGEIIEAMLIEPTVPWWRMRRVQLMICFVILIVLALSISLGVALSKRRQKFVGESAVPPGLSLAPSAPELSISPSSASAANVSSSASSPSAAPACSLDSNCGATLETWNDIWGWSMYELRLYTNALRNKPNETTRLWNLLEAPSNIGDNYGSRIKGLLLPPVTGNYSFWIASDDSSELWLSTDEDPIHAELLCFVYEAVLGRQWDMYSSQESPPIWLVAGQAYYFEADFKEGNNQDHLAIAWKYPGQELQVIPAEYSQIIGPSTYNQNSLVESLTPTLSPQQPAYCSIDSYCGAILETWKGIDGVSTNDLMLYTDHLKIAPSTTDRLWDLLEVPSNADEYYGDNMNGWLVPPVSGDFLFWIASDDNGEFFLNTDYGMVGAVYMMRICYTPEYSGFREWDRTSDQESLPIALVAGQPYYFEVRRKQAVNENHLSVAWQYPGQDREVIPAKYSRTTSLEFTCLDCGATLETWMDIDGWAIDELSRGTENFLLAPSYADRLWTLLESQSYYDYGDYLGQRMKGWLVPPVTGDYKFWISADDRGEFWLSTDDNPENIFLACRCPSTTPDREWQWFRHQESLPIRLVAGQAYYFEALTKQDIGPHSLAIAWQYPGQVLEVVPAKHSRVTNPSTCGDSNCGANLDTWTGISGVSIDDLVDGTNAYTNSPNRTDRLSSLLETVPDQGENYGIRMTGWLLPPTSGNYTFYIASDDAGELWLSTDDDPANKGLVCSCSVAGRREWIAIGEQRSELTQLFRGQAYYFEALMKEARHGDNFALAWEYPGQYREVIPAKFARTTRPNN